MLQQVKEFIAWGLSNIAIRNIIVFFFLVSFSAMAGMVNIIVSLHQQLDHAREREVKCKEEAQLFIDNIRREQIKVLEDAVKRQHNIEEKIVKMQKGNKR